MTDQPPATEQTPAPDTRAEVDPDVAELLGLRPADADALPDADELDDTGEMTDTRIYEGELEARPVDSDQPDRPVADSLEDLTDTEARAGETDDPYEAAEEGLAWIPPVDPPIRPGPNGDPEIAAGFGTTAVDEPFDFDHHDEPVPERDERTARVVEALRADARTTGFADDLVVDSDGGRVVVRGVVADLEDEDAVLAVIDEIPGVSDVVDMLVVETLEALPDPR